MSSAVSLIYYSSNKTKLQEEGNDINFFLLKTKLSLCLFILKYKDNILKIIISHQNIESIEIY